MSEDVHEALFIAAVVVVAFGVAIIAASMFQTVATAQLRALGL